MCGGGGGDNSLALQGRTEQIERQRQGRIREGAAQIEDTFSQKFNPDFYEGVAESFEGFYKPQIDQQFGDASGKILASLVDRGALESTSGLRAMSRLQEEKNLQETQIANQAIDEADRVRGDVEREKTNLFALNETAADPSRIGNLVESASTAIAAPRAYSPIEDVFGSLISSAAQYQSARNNSVAGGSRTPRRTTSVDKSGSGRVVG